MKLFNFRNGIRYLLFLNSIFALQNLSAQEFSLDHVNYKVLSNDSVEVIGLNDNVPLRKIILPDTVKYEGKNYFIQGIQASGSQFICETITLPVCLQYIKGYHTFRSINTIYVKSLSSFCKIEKQKGWSGVTVDSPLKSLYEKEDKIINLVTPYDIKEITNNCFEGISLNSVTLSEGVISIGKNAFNVFGKENINNLYLCSTLKSIGEAAFNQLNKINVYSPSVSQWLGMSMGANVFSIYKGADLYFDNTAATRVVVPSGVTSINDYQFQHINNIEKIVFPASLQEIGEGAFMTCTNLSSITLNGTIQEIGSYSFTDIGKFVNIYLDDISYFINTNLGITGVALYLNGDRVTEINIPEGITEIPDYKFYRFRATKINLPSTLKTIGSYAFAEMPMATINLNEGLENIGTSAFENTTSNDFDFNKYNTKINTLPKSVKSINAFAFKNCIFENQVTFGPNIVTVSQNAFNQAVIPGIFFEEGVEQIEEKAFINATGFSSLNLPQSCITIGLSAFENCKDIKILNLPLNIATISNSAFKNCSGMKEFNLTETSIKQIGESSFEGCSGLNNINLTKSSLTSIARKAFANCETVDSILLSNNILIVRDSAFYNSPANYLDLGTGVQEIGSNALFIDSEMVVNVPNSLNKYGKNAIHGYVNIIDLKKWCNLEREGSLSIGSIQGVPLSNNYTLVIPDGIETVGKYAFGGLKGNSEHGIRSIIIPSSVKEIEDYAFYNWNATTLIIGSGVEKIGDEAFGIVSYKPWPQYQQIVVQNSNPPIIEDNSFNNLYSTLKVFVPESSIENYYNKWPHFDNFLSIPQSEAIKLPFTTIELPQNQNYYLNLEDLNINVDNLTGVQSSNPNIVICGLSYDRTTIYINPIIEGEAQLEIFNKYGIKSTYEIKVIPAIPPMLEIYPSVWLAEPGQTIYLDAIVSPEDINFEELKWSSSDETVAIVNDYGLVTALSIGNAIITATCEGVSATCEVMVVKDAGLENLINDDSEAFEIYSLEGILIKKDCKIQDLKFLHRGIYIIVCGKERYKISI